jgi:tyrosyl-tRNA synthetase
VQVAEIEKMKREAHPMQAKKELARRIVGDFHSVETAAKAGEDWARQFQKSEVPEELERVDVRLADVEVDPIGGHHGAVVVIGRGVNPSKRYIVRLDKLIRHAGLANSNSEAGGKLRGGAVAIDGETIGESNFIAEIPLDDYFVLRVGRRMKKVRLVDSARVK